MLALPFYSRKTCCRPSTLGSETYTNDLLQKGKDGRHYALGGDFRLEILASEDFFVTFWRLLSLANRGMLDVCLGGNLSVP